MTTNTECLSVTFNNQTSNIHCNPDILLFIHEFIDVYKKNETSYEKFNKVIKITPLNKIHDYVFVDEMQQTKSLYFAFQEIWNYKYNENKRNIIPDKILILFISSFTVCYFHKKLQISHNKNITQSADLTLLCWYILREIDPQYKNYRYMTTPSMFFSHIGHFKEKHSFSVKETQGMIEKILRIYEIQEINNKVVWQPYGLFPLKVKSKEEQHVTKLRSSKVTIPRKIFHLFSVSFLFDCNISSYPRIEGIMPICSKRKRSSEFDIFYKSVQCSDYSSENFNKVNSFIIKFINSTVEVQDEETED
jgi:hypothetical protein